MKILDRYILFKFLGTFFFAILLIIVIVIFFDVSEKMEDFLRHHVSLREIVFDYYLNFIPYFMNLFSPLFTFIAVIFFTAKLAGQTEIVAMLASGISFRRLMLPYMMGATVIAGLTFVLDGWLIPKSNITRLEFENAYVGSPFRFDGHNVHRQIRPGEYIYLESYNNLEKIGYKFSIEKFENGELKSKLLCDLIKWDSVSTKWHLSNYFAREINGMLEKTRSGANKDTTFPFSPADFAKRANTVETMNNGELAKYIDAERQRGSERVNFYLVEKYRRYAAPFTTYILTLIGLALSSRKVRGGIGLQLGIGLGLSFTYILFQQIFRTFSTNGNFSPLMGVWIPNFIFAGLAVYLMRTAPK